MEPEFATPPYPPSWGLNLAGMGYRGPVKGPGATREGWLATAICGEGGSSSRPIRPRAVSGSATQTTASRGLAQTPLELGDAPFLGLHGLLSTRCQGSAGDGSWRTRESSPPARSAASSTLIRMTSARGGQNHQRDHAGEVAQAEPEAE